MIYIVKNLVKGSKHINSNTKVCIKSKIYFIILLKSSL